jgi:hypothetical protein
MKGKQLFKSFCYRWLVTSWLGVVINNRLLTIVAAGLFGGWFLYLDIFGDQDTWFQANFDLVRRLFIGTLFVGLLVEVLRWVADWSKGPNSTEGSAIIELFLSVGRIVEQKIVRFRSVAQTYSGSSAFQRLTKPESQIELILTEANDYFRRQHLLNEHQLDATVLHLSSANAGWEFVFRSNPNRTRTDPGILMSKESSASFAHATGQPCFFPSKKSQAIEERYRFGPNESNDGSIYCYPVKIPTKNGERSFVITFATYGKCLCEELNKRDLEAFSVISREFSRRIELELVLWTIKDYKKPAVVGNVKSKGRRKK